MPSLGLHHVTAISGDPQRTRAFYCDVLGLRLVKKTVNFDDPGTYHLYFGDERGSPGTILTVFPFPGAARGQAGRGQAVELSFAIPLEAVGFWIAHFVARGVVHGAPMARFGATVIPFRDPDGMMLELVARAPTSSDPRPWGAGPIPAEHALRGFAGQTLWVGEPAGTARVLTDVFGFVPAGADGAFLRFEAPGQAVGRRIDLRVVGGFPNGTMGAGSIHHVAFRAPDDPEQATMALRARALGLGVTAQADRCYFRSVYFREPGGVLFEIATDAPGFSVDEPVEHLGEGLQLPPWLEPQRAAIAARLPPLDDDSATRAAEAPRGLQHSVRP